MEEKRIYLSNSDCSKCASIKPRVIKAAQNKWIELTEMDAIDRKEAEILTIPTLVVEKWEEKQYLTDSDLIEYIRP